MKTQRIYDNEVDLLGNALVSHGVGRFAHQLLSDAVPTIHLVYLTARAFELE